MRDYQRAAPWLHQERRHALILAALQRKSFLRMPRAGQMLRLTVLMSDEKTHLPPACCSLFRSERGNIIPLTSSNRFTEHLFNRALGSMSVPLPVHGVYCPVMHLSVVTGLPAFPGHLVPTGVRFSLSGFCMLVVLFFNFWSWSWHHAFWLSCGKERMCLPHHSVPPHMQSHARTHTQPKTQP